MNLVICRYGNCKTYKCINYRFKDYMLGNNATSKKLICVNLLFNQFKVSPKDKVGNNVFAVVFQYFDGNLESLLRTVGRFDETFSFAHENTEAAAGYLQARVIFSQCLSKLHILGRVKHYNHLLNQF